MIIPLANVFPQEYILIISILLLFFYTQFNLLDKSSQFHEKIPSSLRATFNSIDLMAKIKKMQETQPFSEFLIHCVEDEDQIWFTSCWKESDNSNVNENKIESEKGLTAFNKIAQKFTANATNQEAKVLKNVAKVKKANSAEIREIKDQVRYVFKELDKRYPAFRKFIRNGFTLNYPLFFMKT